MGESPTNAVGSVVWQDLTVADAAPSRDFYAAVIGWRFEEGEGDFNMFPATGIVPAAGICCARGPNAKMPPVWMLYLRVARLDVSVAEAVRRGGSVVDGPRPAGAGRICVLRDPAGAAVALYEIDG